MCAKTHRSLWLPIACCLLLAAGPLGALVESEGTSPLAEKAVQLPELPQEFKAPSQLASRAQHRALTDLAALGVAPETTWLDARSGRWATLRPSTPLLPGNGVGNSLVWDKTTLEEPRSQADWQRAAWRAFTGYLSTHQKALRIDPTEVPTGRVTVYEDGKIIHLYAPRRIDGIPVRGSYLTAVINRGNLILFGAQHWGERPPLPRTRLSANAAQDAAQSFFYPMAPEGTWGKPELVWIPTAEESSYGHRLAWLSRPRFAAEDGRWELLLDATSGEVMSFVDTNHYVATPREVQGGVYPVTNDGIVPDGVEQAGWPMPYINVTTPSGTVTTDTGGNLPSPVDGNITASLSGQFVNINDNCGASSLTSSGDLDFGTSGGDDCVTPGFGGAGNTHASRTGFYELNKIIEMARSHLPSNTWLQQTLTSNMNINNTCNAFWNGVSVNFYRSGGGCFNTGEIAGVFDHEWGHGIDDNDAVPSIASPSGEGIADIYTALRLNDSCIGRNFRATVCTGFGDPCLTCTGVRDIDYLKRQSGQPHDYSWSNANCGGSVHCVGAVYAEAVWSLWKRELTAAPYNMSNNTAHEVTTRLTFIGAGNTGTWFSGGPPNGGCAANSGYMNYLAADDDNGNLNDGTPHMTAIFNAFNDQEIACGTPTVQDSGCANTPTLAPNVVANPADKSVSLTWGAVPNATKYQVFRTEGVFACDFGKVKLGETTGTAWNDNGLQNGRQYSYIVIPFGPGDSCFGPASSCTNASPAAGPNLDVDPSSAALVISSGDGDAFLDNCESATLSFDVNNTGLGALTNVRITGVTAVSHPSINITTSFPAAVAPSGLAEGATGTGSFSFTADGLSFNDTVNFQVEVTSNELSPTTKAATLTLLSAESDFQNFASRTFNFETDTEGWTVVQGTFNRTSTGGGASGTTWYEASSANLDNQCDQIRSPIMSLSSTSTLSLSNQYDIEPFYTPSSSWYDRANLGVREVATGTHTPVSPDGGRLYNASGGNGNCGTAGQPGWADAATTWGQSTWSAAALGSAGYAGDQVQLEVRYGTDSSLNGFGFHFDEVTVTDVDFQVADTQSNSCSAGCTNNSQCDDGLFCNGAETCNVGTGQCQAGTAPSCGDGVSCTVDSCNEGTDSCDNTPNDGLCDNGLFCDGSETCDPVLDCQAGSDPCPGLSCDEGANLCVGLANAQLESDCLSVGSGGTTVALTNTYVSPVVVASVQYNNNTRPVVPRVSNATATSFDLRLQSPSGGSPSAENVCYMVVEEGTWTIDGVAVEAQRYTSTTTSEAPSGWVPDAQSYGQSYTNPVVVGQVMSENDPDFSVFWNQGSALTNPPSSSALSTGKTVCEDTDITRAEETVGFIVFEAGHGTLAGVEYEAALGADTVAGVANTPPYAYTFNTAFASAPTVATVQMSGVDGNNGGWAQTHGPTMASATSLFLSIDEDVIGDTERSHTTEQVSYVVFGGPVVYPPISSAGQVEWGSTIAGGTAVTVNLTNTYTNPVVVASAQYANNTTPIVTRVSNVTGTSFDVRLQNPSGGAVAAENISYLVVEEGTHSIGGINIEAQTYTSTVTDENGSWVGEVQSYLQSYTNPVVLGQVMSENDPAWSVFWNYGDIRTNPPTAANLVTGKSVCEDSNITRANETIGIIVFEADHATLGGVEFEAALGADTVLGVTNAPPYTYTFGTAFGSAPTIAITTLAGLDGGNGGWAQVHGSTVATTTSLFLSIDEDQILDAERGHISEQVGYVVFVGAGSVP